MQEMDRHTKTILGTLNDMHRGLTISLKDSAIITRGDDGVHIRPRTKNKKPRRVAISEIAADRLREHRRQVESQLSAMAGESRSVAPSDLVFSGSTGRGRTPDDGLPWRPDTRERLDALVVAPKVILEGDGRAWHARLRDFDRDRWRDNEAAAHGYLVLRFTFVHLAHRFEDCVGLGASVLAARQRRAS